jgi:hypothetical protein
VLRVLILAAALATLTGCGATTVETPPSTIDLTELVGILPTPSGLDQSREVRPVDAAGLQEMLAGVARAESAAVFREIGFRAGAVRTWRGDGATMWVAVSRWPDRQTATNVGGGAVQQFADTTGATAWTPRALAGARGARFVKDSETRMLSIAIGDVSLVVRADGPIGDDTVVRTMDLLARPVRAAAP